MIAVKVVRPNGMAQRQRWDWRDSFAIIAHFWQIAPARERRSRLPVPPVLTVFIRAHACPPRGDCGVRCTQSY